MQVDNFAVTGAMLELMGFQQPLIEAQHTAQTRMQVGIPCPAFAQIAEGHAVICLSSVVFRDPLNASQQTAADLYGWASSATCCRAQVACGVLA